MAALMGPSEAAKIEDIDDIDLEEYFGYPQSLNIHYNYKPNEQATEKPTENNDDDNDALISITSDKANVVVGDTFTITVSAEGFNANNIMEFFADIKYDASLVKMVGDINKASLRDGGFEGTIIISKEEEGYIQQGGMSAEIYVSDSYTSFTATFEALATGEAVFDFVYGEQFVAYDIDDNKKDLVAEICKVFIGEKQTEDPATEAPNENPTDKTIETTTEKIKPDLKNLPVRTEETEGYLYIAKGLTVAQTKEALKEYTVNILDINGNKLEDDDAIGTGSVIEIYDGETLVEKKIVIFKGDINGDGQVKTTDARNALRAALGLDNLSDAQALAADVNNDGNLKATDARAILRGAMGLDVMETWIENE